MKHIVDLEGFVGIPDGKYVPLEDIEKLQHATLNLLWEIEVAQQTDGGFTPMLLARLDDLKELLRESTP